ncbi:MAG: helix-turn-helix domain-containing protein [Acidimicrobiales bacterium]|nr:helix-turn-helix domain-containing protein [Acidimicrobiales bacterium]
MLELTVIDEPDAAASVLDPTRAAILEVLAEPGSATTIAGPLGLSRQKVNYHLRALEAHGLVQLVEERPRRGLTERVMVASARSYVLSPQLLGRNAADPKRTDRLSTRYLIAVAGRMVSEVAELARRAERQNKPLATLSIDTEIRFASASDRAAFAQELAETITSLAARYHHETAPKGRWHRLVVAVHPKPQTPTSKGSKP